MTEANETCIGLVCLQSGESVLRLDFALPVEVTVRLSDTPVHEGLKVLPGQAIVLYDELREAHWSVLAVSDDDTNPE